ncbi:hypothetical protein HZS_6441 [Henneguya salminicola]|nr:hypothetical protein HZS_6441 [Henneguya salminicola]
MSPSVSLLPNTPPFFRRYWVDDIHRIQHNMTIWESNQSLSLLRYKSSTVVDGTFRTTLSPFSQCLIIMVFDDASDLYIPFVFNPVTGKNKHIYWEFLHHVIMHL